MILTTVNSCSGAFVLTLELEAKVKKEMSTTRRPTESFEDERFGLTRTRIALPTDFTIIPTLLWSEIYFVTHYL